MATRGENRTLADLVGGIARDLAALFRTELALARTEAQENVGRAVSGIAYIAIGGGLLLGAFIVLLGAAVTGLAIIFIAMGMDPQGANAVSAVIVGVIVAIIGYVLVMSGMHGLKAQNLWIDRTQHSVARDAEVLKEKVNG
jgi:hypothetical protein